MSKYFEPIDIRAEREANKPKPATVDTDVITDVTIALDAIAQIIADLEAGVSPLRSGAIHFPDGKSCPVKETLARLRAFPTSKSTVRQFILTAQGDLGRRVAQAMADHLKFSDNSIMEVFDEPKANK